MNSGSAEYLTFGSTGEIWRFMTEKWAALSSSAIEKRGYCAVALSGGKTPVGFYQHLSTVPGLPWDKTHIFLVDERFVPPDSPDSNFGMLRKTLLSSSSMPAINIHPVSTVEPSAIVSAEKYEQELKTFFSGAEGISLPSISSFSALAKTATRHHFSPAPKRCGRRSAGWSR